MNYTTGEKNHLIPIAAILLAAFLAVSLFGGIVQFTDAYRATSQITIEEIAEKDGDVKFGAIPMGLLILLLSIVGGTLSAVARISKGLQRLRMFWAQRVYWVAGRGANSYRRALVSPLS